MANDTKERILDAALEMFSQNGYAGTNIRELSASLGLVKSGVYKHYESKEAIWNALLDKMIAYYADHFGSADHLPPVPDSLEELIRLTMQMVNITVHDEKIIMTRKVLTLEQYRDVRACGLATKHFLTGLTEMFTRIFTGMMEKGLLRQDDPEMLAYYTKWREIDISASPYPDEWKNKDGSMKDFVTTAMLYEAFYDSLQYQFIMEDPSMHRGWNASVNIYMDEDRFVHMTTGVVTYQATYDEQGNLLNERGEK